MLHLRYFLACGLVDRLFEQRMQGVLVHLACHLMLALGDRRRRFIVRET
jgi:hypothetical protein